MESPPHPSFTRLTPLSPPNENWYKCTYWLLPFLSAGNVMVTWNMLDSSARNSILVVWSKICYTFIRPDCSHYLKIVHSWNSIFILFSKLGSKILHNFPNPCTSDWWDINQDREQKTDWLVQEGNQWLAQELSGKVAVLWYGTGSYNGIM